MTNFSTGQRRKNLVAGRVAEHVKSYVYRKKKNRAVEAPMLFTLLPIILLIPGQA